MREQIHKSLLLMGLVSVVVTFMISGILYFQGMQERAVHEISHITQIVAQGMTGDLERDRARLDAIRAGSKRELRVLWMKQDGEILYSSTETPDPKFLERPEVTEAAAEGSGHATRKDDAGVPMSYFTERLPDGSILRFAVQRTAPAGVLQPLLPEIMLFVIVFIVGCIAAAEKETEYVLRPLRKVEGLISDIMEGAPERPIPGGYRELEPLVNKVREQKREIQNYTEDLEEERNTIRTVIDTISDGIILLNDRQEIVDVNVHVKDIFHKNEEMRFRKIAALYHDEDWLRAVGLAFGEEERQSYTMMIYGRPYRASMARVELADDVMGLLIVVHDLTATYAAEKMRREFSANVSHELKTPLTSISGFAEMIANGMAQNEQDVKLFGSRIFDESRRMLSLIETIMHLSKIEENQTTITWKPVNMGAAARYAVDIIEPQAKARNVTVRVEETAAYVYGNQPLLFELVMNCVDNAVKYNKEGGEVNVRVAREEDNVVLTVSDTGIGIPKDKQQRVFERFYRAEESRSKETGGSGLGLAICKHIVTQHRGTITLESVEGEGTTFRVVLPKMSDEDVEKEIRASGAAQIEAAKAEAGTLETPEVLAEAEKKVEESKAKKLPPKVKKEKKDKDAKETKDSKDNKDKKEKDKKPKKVEKPEKGDKQKKK